jgi:hypothetical protein
VSLLVGQRDKNLLPNSANRLEKFHVKPCMDIYLGVHQHESSLEKQVLGINRTSLYGGYLVREEVPSVSSHPQTPMGGSGKMEVE